jgi:hypothetical protein
MGLKLSGFMIKGELPQSACEILQMCGVPRSFIHDGIEENEFSETEYEQIKKRATRYEVREPGEFDLEEIDESKIIYVIKRGGWTIIRARYAFVGIPSDYTESCVSALQAYYEHHHRQHFESYLAGNGLFTPETSEDTPDGFNQQSFEPTEVWKAKMRRILQTQLSNPESSFALRQLSYGDERLPFDFDNHGHSYEQLLEEVEDRKTRLRDELSNGGTNPRNYDALKILSHGGEAIHFYTESISGSRGFARFVDGKAIHPIWYYGDPFRGLSIFDYEGGLSIFDYEAGQWTIGLDKNYVDNYFDEELVQAVYCKYAPGIWEDWDEKTPIQYCYIK